MRPAKKKTRPAKNEAPKLTNIPTLAQRWGMSTGHLRNLISRGEFPLPIIKIKNAVRVNLDAVREFEKGVK